MEISRICILSVSAWCSIFVFLAATARIPSASIIAWAARCLLVLFLLVNEGLLLVLLWPFCYLMVATNTIEMPRCSFLVMISTVSISKIATVLKRLPLVSTLVVMMVAVCILVIPLTLSILKAVSSATVSLSIPITGRKLLSWTILSSTILAFVSVPWYVGCVISLEGFRRVVRASKLILSIVVVSIAWIVSYGVPMVLLGSILVSIIFFGPLFFVVWSRVSTCESPFVVMVRALVLVLTRVFSVRCQWVRSTIAREVVIIKRGEVPSSSSSVVFEWAKVIVWVVLLGYILSTLYGVMILSQKFILVLEVFHNLAAVITIGAAIT